MTSPAPLRVLVYGYALWARIALVSPWFWCSAPLRALVLDTAHGQGFRLSPCGPGAHRHCARWYAVPFFGQGLRLPLRGPGAQRHCARWYADTAYGQGLRLSLRGPGTHVFSAGHLRRPGLLHEAWCSVGPCTQVHGQGFPRHQGGEGVAGTPGVLTPRCSATRIRCICCVAWTDTSHILKVRTTTTTREQLSNHKPMTPSGMGLLVCGAGSRPSCRLGVAGGNCQPV